METMVTRSRVWYLLPIFFGIIGSLISYVVVRHDDPKLGRGCLILGTILSSVGILLTWYVGMYLLPEESIFLTSL